VPNDDDDDERRDDDDVVVVVDDVVVVVDDDEHQCGRSDWSQRTFTFTFTFTSVLTHLSIPVLNLAKLKLQTVADKDVYARSLSPLSPYTPYRR
jgi:hypothetical protein